MAVVAIYSVKGGVGKTTLAANLAWCSAMHTNQETLLWDLDPFGGATFLFQVIGAKHVRMSTLFEVTEPKVESLISTSLADRLKILRADESIQGLDAQLQKVGGRKRLQRLIGRLSRSFDRIILDCPPAKNAMTYQVLQSADIVIVPMPPSPLSVRAFDTVGAEIAQLGRNRPSVLPVLTMIDMRRKLHREAREAAPNWPYIPMASALEQTAVRRAPIDTFSPNSPGARAISNLWEAIERKIAQRARLRGVPATLRTRPLIGGMPNGASEVRPVVAEKIRA